jgi:uncharacterized membrane protein YfcA
VDPKLILLVVLGVVVGVGASFSGLGGGFLMVPLLLGFAALVLYVHHVLTSIE